MRLLRVALVFVVGLVVLGHQPGAWACSCAPSSMREHFGRADAVFAGTVTNREDPNAGASVRSSADPIIWTFDVDSTQKGRVEDPQQVRSEQDGASCGFGFEIGRRYQVFADDGEGGYHTGLCSGTYELASGAQPFGASLPVTGAGSSAVGAAALAGAALLAVLLGTAASRRHRSSS